MYRRIVEYSLQIPLMARRRDFSHLVEDSNCNNKIVGELAFETSESTTNGMPLELYEVTEIRQPHRDQSWQISLAF